MRGAAAAGRGRVQGTTRPSKPFFFFPGGPTASAAVGPLLLRNNGAHLGSAHAAPSSPVSAGLGTSAPSGCPSAPGQAEMVAAPFGRDPMLNLTFLDRQGGGGGSGWVGAQLASVGDGRDHRQGVHRANTTVFISPFQVPINFYS